LRGTNRPKGEKHLKLVRVSGAHDKKSSEGTIFYHLDFSEPFPFVIQKVEILFYNGGADMALSKSTQKTYQAVIRKFEQMFPEVTKSDDPKVLANAINLFLYATAYSSSSNMFYKNKSAMLYLINGRKIQLKEKRGIYDKLYKHVKTKFPSYATIRNKHDFGKYTSRVTKRRKQGISQEHFNKMYSIAKPREKALLEIELATGMRTSELVRGASLDIKNGKLYVSIESSKKNDKGTVGADRVVIIDIDKLKEICPDMAILEYKNTSELYNSLRTAQDNFRKLRIKAGIRKEIDIYTFRHQMRSSLSKELPPEEVAKYMGHQSVKSQTAYGSIHSKNSFHLSVDVETDNQPRGSFENNYRQDQKNISPENTDIKR
jgi:integrase